MTNQDQKLKAAHEVLEAYTETGIKPTNLDTALATMNAFLDDDMRRIRRGGGCLLCHFEKWYYEPLTGQEAAQKLREDHQRSHPTCPRQFISYGGDPTEEELEEEELDETEEL